jgi:hypothetical protein
LVIVQTGSAIFIDATTKYAQAIRCRIPGIRMLWRLMPPPPMKMSQPCVTTPITNSFSVRERTFHLRPGPPYFFIENAIDTPT